MMDFIPFMDPQYFFYSWLIIAIIFLFAELSTPGLFIFIAFAIGSAVAAIMAILDFSLITQCIVGLIFSMISFFVLRYFFSVKKQNGIKTNFEALVGQEGVVTHSFEPLKLGRVKIKGEEWVAQSESEQGVFQKGIVVIVVGVKGNCVLVKKR